MSDNEKRATDFVGSVARAFAILECFTTDEALRLQGRMTLTDAARLTDLSRGTARRLLLTLAELHYVDTDGKYFWLTPKLVNLSRGFLMPLGLGEGSRAVLYSLTQKLDESASVGVLDGADIVYIERVEVRRIYSSRIVSGTRLPASSSSIGRVLLAALSENELSSWLEAYPISQYTAKTLTDPKSFLEEIAQVRQNGYAIIDEELEMGIRSIAVPVFSRNSRVVAALNASTVSARHSVDDLREQFLPELKIASERLSQTMAW
ncbi:IclR family transcriptional regulator C-terminal domain-containing protein [Notoacmeibacter sp. MSK16QG-6]|uniref:IclR family transcriptional regulator domain-containing protein n=1 Tax=Notoacmeibacter sp. MSK16QG-6 TaxID=2957982 RepID=UPI00209FBF1D|nr:helix-turn-helix domain-containing protein [Notoacmeibacter sp. MSK16QG-6]